MDKIHKLLPQNIDLKLSLDSPVTSRSRKVSFSNRLFGRCKMRVLSSVRLRCVAIIGVEGKLIHEKVCPFVALNEFTYIRKLTSSPNDAGEFSRGGI